MRGRSKEELLTRISDEDRIEFCRSKNVRPEDHCCLDMAWFISEPIEWPSQGPNPVILWLSQFNEYRIDISLRGHSSTPIYFCPWCGRRLPGSKREEWYETLYALGFNDPSEQNVPDQFESDAWWRRPG